MKQEDGFEIHTLVFSKEKFPEQSAAVAWADEHGFKSDKVESNETEWMLIQFDQATCEAGTGSSVEIEEGIKGDGCKKAAAVEAEAVSNSAKSKGKFLSAEVKANGVNATARTVEGWASVEEVDRQGELMLATAFEKMLDRFKVNPVLCWCHNIFAPPIGSVVDIEIVPGKGIKFKAKFAHTKFADEILQLFKDRALRAFSVQFIPHETREPNDAEKTTHGATLKQTITVAELLEISPVPVPAVAHALAGKAKTLDLSDWETLTLKSFFKAEGDEEDLDTQQDQAGARAELMAAQELLAQASEALGRAVSAMPEDDVAEGDTDAEDDKPPTDEELASVEGLVNSVADMTKTAAGRLGSSTGTGS